MENTLSINNGSTDNKTMTIEELIIEAMQNRRAKNIVMLDFNQMERSVCNTFIIANADSTTQVRAIADHIQDETRMAKYRTISREGDENALWIILDYGDIVVHIFETATREYYKLDQLWSDAKITRFETID